mmetsp:Transcript_46346/g.116714  ORF Transcript_46346/g.116714 Transcript_46346/m.116714 type:complete len:212 (+) Transcript_46346:446-1081(+)
MFVFGRICIRQKMKAVHASVLHRGKQFLLAILICSAWLAQNMHQEGRRVHAAILWVFVSKHSVQLLGILLKVGGHGRRLARRPEHLQVHFRACIFRWCVKGLHGNPVLQLATCGMENRLDEEGDPKGSTITGVQSQPDVHAALLSHGLPNLHQRVNMRLRPVQQVRGVELPRLRHAEPRALEKHRRGVGDGVALGSRVGDQERLLRRGECL